MHMAKIQQALLKGIIPIAQVACTAMGAKSMNQDDIQLVKMRCLEALSLLSHVSYELNIQRRFLTFEAERASLALPIELENIFSIEIKLIAYLIQRTPTVCPWLLEHCVLAARSLLHGFFKLFVLNKKSELAKPTLIVCCSSCRFAYMFNRFFWGASRRSRASLFSTARLSD